MKPRYPHHRFGVSNEFSVLTIFLQGCFFLFLCCFLTLHFFALYNLSSKASKYNTVVVYTPTLHRSLICSINFTLFLESQLACLLNIFCYYNLSLGKERSSVFVCKGKSLVLECSRTELSFFSLLMSLYYLPSLFYFYQMPTLHTGPFPKWMTFGFLVSLICLTGTIYLTIGLQLSIGTW